MGIRIYRSWIYYIPRRRAKRLRQHKFLELPPKLIENDDTLCLELRQKQENESVHKKENVNEIEKIWNSIENAERELKKIRNSLISMNLVQEFTSQNEVKKEFQVIDAKDKVEMYVEGNKKKKKKQSKKSNNESKENDDGNIDWIQCESSSTKVQQWILENRENDNDEEKGKEEDGGTMEPLDDEELEILTEACHLPPENTRVVPDWNLDEENGNENGEIDEIVQEFHEKLDVKVVESRKKKRKTDKQKIYEPHLDPIEIERQLKKGILVKGTLRKLNLSGIRVGFVRVCDGNDEELIIYGDKPLNRGFDGDLVAVQRLEMTPEEPENDTKPKNSKMKKQDGKIVGILKRGLNRIGVGTFISCRNDMNFKSSDSYLLFKPQDGSKERALVHIKQIPNSFRVDLFGLKVFAGRLFSIEYSEWFENFPFPFGKRIQCIGESGSIHTETNAILIQNQIPLKAFPDDAFVNELPKIPWTIPDEEISEYSMENLSLNELIHSNVGLKRVDLRTLRVFSIDPETARDLDDCLSIRKYFDIQSNAFCYEVGVHIADVSYFVKNGMELDKEAQSRSTSVYLVNKVIPMLPRVLCENLCSLQQSVDRLTVSVIWKMDSNGNILQKWFGRTVIRSIEQLSYSNAQKMIDSDEDLSEIAQDVKELNRLAQNIRQRRFENGCLTLNSSKLKFELDKDRLPVDFGEYQNGESNRLVEEFMLLANVSVAEFIADAFPNDALLRCHPEPKQSMMKELELWSEMHLKSSYSGLDLSSSGALQKSLDQIRVLESNGSSIRDIVELKVTKPMQNAVYFCTKSRIRSMWKHYALAFDKYTHFTSPIRRYPDIIVHRMLIAAIFQHGNEGIVDENSVNQCKIDFGDVESICERSNERKWAAKRAQEASGKLFLCVLLEAEARTLKGIVLNVDIKRMEIYIPVANCVHTLEWNHMEIQDGIKIECVDTDKKSVLIVVESCAMEETKGEEMDSGNEVEDVQESKSKSKTKLSKREKKKLRAEKVKARIELENNGGIGESKFNHVIHGVVPQQLSVDSVKSLRVVGEDQHDTSSMKYLVCLFDSVAVRASASTSPMDIRFQLYLY